MRRRLLLSTLGSVAVAIVLLGVPLAWLLRSTLERQAFDQLESVAADAAQRDEPQREILLDRRAGVRLQLFQARGDRLELLADTHPEGAPVRGTDDLRDALGERGLGRTRMHGMLAVALPVEGSPGLVWRVTASDAGVRARARLATVWLASLAGFALLVGVVLALWQAQRLAVPLEQLAASARRLGDGDFSVRAPRTGLPEPDDVADALDATADRLGAMLERSRSFGADASHQLRTPLTALRLDLEVLESTGAEPALVKAAVAEADRLEATIDELLSLAAAPPGEEHINLADLVAQRLDAWRSLAAAQGREVVLRAEEVPPVRARSAALGQSLQVLLDNALEHGAGTTTVRVENVAGGVRLCVADEGPGLHPADADALLGRRADARDRSAGRGLPLLRSLVEAEGGRVVLEHDAGGTIVCLLLPVAASTR